jgi:hypothetical protein
VDFGELNDNTIKGLTSLLSVEKEIIAYTWILHTKMYQKFKKKASLMVFHIVEMKAKIMYCCIGRSCKQSTSSKDNNANRINEMASMLWDIIASCESKHIWQMANETWVDDFELVSIVACFAWTRRVGQWTSLD